MGCYVEDDWSKARIIGDIDMQLVIEMGTHRGISYIAHRYAKANNKYMRDCNTETETSYITYLDANNLYGWAMIQALPTGAFKWLKQATIRDLANLTEDSERGVILELTWNILKNYMIFIMNIQLQLKNKGNKRDAFSLL